MVGEEGWPFVAPKSVPMFAWMEHSGDSLWEMLRFCVGHHFVTCTVFMRERMNLC